MELSALFLVTSLTLALPPKLLDSLCYVESHYDPAAINPLDGTGSSLGLCQVQKPTCKEMGIEGDLFDPKTNIECAGRFLKKQIERYNGNVRRGVCAYNKGNSSSDGNNRYTRKVFGEWSRRAPESYLGYVRQSGNVRSKEARSPSIRKRTTYSR